MAIVYLPAAMQELTGGMPSVEAAGRTVSEVVRNLEQLYPGVEESLVEEGALRPGIAIAIDGEIKGRRLAQRVRPDSEIHFIPAIFGG